MTQSHKPSGLPVPNPTKSYWQTPPHKIANHRSTARLPESSQYVIVGSGITGASIALKLLTERPSASIVMLEARQAASGASGRNGGHCRSSDYLSFKTNLDKFGKEEALRVEDFEETNVKNVGDFIKKHGINCDLRDVETFDITTDPEQWEAMLEALKVRKDVGNGKLDSTDLTKHRIWSAKEIREELLIPNGVGAVSFPAFVLSPYKFVCALLEMSMDLGLNLQTNTPAFKISRLAVHSSERWMVDTERGRVFTDYLILATNAYTSVLYPALSDFIIPTRGQVAAIRPGSNIAGNPILNRTYGLSDAISEDYFQSRGEAVSGSGDLIVGGGRRLGMNGEQPIWDDSAIHPTISKYLTKQVLLKYYGRETWGKDGDILMQWTGIMGYTVDRKPLIGEVIDERGLYICAGFNGNGMALTFQSAEALVQLLLGNEEEVNLWLPKCYRLSRLLK